MQVCLAYAFDAATDAERVERALLRIEQHYGPISSQPLVRRGRQGPRTGTLIWDAAHPACRWPVWAEDGDAGVATVYVPVGWQRILGPSEMERAPLALARALAAAPERLADLHAPFALVRVDGRTDELRIMVDGLGFARMYEMRFDGGWAWSNRLGALPLFAERVPEMDLRGWQTLAGSGWFMGESTALDGVTMLPPGAVVRAGGAELGGRTVRRGDAIAGWVRPTAEGAIEVGAMAEQIVEVARDAERLWSQPPRVDLSGGRDSRAVAAAVIAAGVGATFNTTATFEDEVAVVQRLLGRLPQPVEHEVRFPADVTATGDLRERAVGFHLVYDGMTSPTFVAQNRPKKLGALRQASLTGAGGEIAHGHYYPPHVGRLHRRGLAGAFERLDGIMRWQGGVREETHATVSAHVSAVLEEGAALGLEGAVLTDYFYLLERLRRWSSASVRLGRLMPLTTPSFIRSSFNMTPKQRADNLIHRRLIARLLPQWGDIPFYKARPSAHRRSPRRKAWETSDRTVLEELVNQPGLWDDVFDPARIRTMWAEIEAGKGTPRHEVLLQRLVWRSTFPEHLRTLGAAVARLPAIPEIRTSAPSTGTPGTVAR